MHAVEQRLRAEFFLLCIQWAFITDRSNEIHPPHSAGLGIKDDLKEAVRANGIAVVWRVR